MSDQPQRRDRGGMLAVVRGQLPEDLSQLRGSLVSLLVRITFPHLTTTCAPTDGLPLHRLAPHGDALEKPSGGERPMHARCHPVTSERAPCNRSGCCCRRRYELGGDVIPVATPCSGCKLHPSRVSEEWA